MGEHSITQAKASVMLYDNERKQWQHSGGAPGLSRVNIYHHPQNNTFRIVGRKLDDHTVVINCALARGLKYNEATPTFHQWRDQRQVYGLNFQSSEDANRFGQEVRKALETLKEPSAAPAQSYQREQYYQDTVSNGPSHDDIMRQQRQNADYDSHDNYSSRTRVPSAGGQYRQYDSQMSGGGSESESPSSSQLSVASSLTQASPVQTSAPQAPTPPPAPPAPAAPAAPPAPPTAPAAPAPPQPPPAPGIGGPPAPPPPPPAPSGGGGGSLADQIAAAKLRKSSRGDSGVSDGGGMRTERSGSRSNNAGGVGGMDMMAEMQKKLAARRAKTEDKPVSNGPVKQEEERSFPAVRSTTTSSSPTPPPFSSNKTNFANQPNKTSSSRFNSTNSKSEVTLTSDQLEEFKTELLSAFRQELENYKEEIIQAVRQEVSKNM